jgi:hypothetical protein
MTKTEAALGGALILAGVALGVQAYKDIRAERVIIIKDGSVEFSPINSDLDEANAPDGKKYKWSEKAKRVVLAGCGETNSAPRTFQRLVLTAGTDSAAEVDLQFENEGWPGNLAISFGTSHSIEWTGAGHFLRRENDTYEDLKILRVQIDSEGTLTGSGKCRVVFLKN